MNPAKELYVGQLMDPETHVPTGYAVLAAGGRIKIGPNPLTRRAAMCVRKVLIALDMDYSFPQQPTSGAHNAARVTCPKLKSWLQGAV